MNADDRAQVGARLKTARRRAGYRNRQDASEALERLGLHWTPSTVEKVEMGQRRAILERVEVGYPVSGDLAALVRAGATLPDPDADEDL